MTYLLDANVFIQAKNLHYGLDFCPAFWNWILEKNQAGIIFSIDKVSDEIEKSADYYLIGHALARNSVIVTHEVPSTSIKKIKIPNVCAVLGISFLNPFEMLRRERASFVLGFK